MKNILLHKLIAIPLEQIEGKRFFYSQLYIVELLQDVEELVATNPITDKKTTTPASKKWMFSRRISNLEMSVIDLEIYLKLCGQIFHALFVDLNALPETPQQQHLLKQFSEVLDHLDIPKTEAWIETHVPPSETVAMIKHFFAEEGEKIEVIGGIIDSLNQRDWGRHIPTLTNLTYMFKELDRPITHEKWVRNHYGFKFATVDRVVANAKYVLGLNAAMGIPFPPHSTVNRARIFTEIFPDLEEVEFKYKRLRLDSSVAPSQNA